MPTLAQRQAAKTVHTPAREQGLPYLAAQPISGAPTHERAKPSSSAASDRSGTLGDASECGAMRLATRLDADSSRTRTRDTAADEQEHIKADVLNSLMWGTRTPRADRRRANQCFSARADDRQKLLCDEHRPSPSPRMTIVARTLPGPTLPPPSRPIPATDIPSHASSRSLSTTSLPTPVMTPYSSLSLNSSYYTTATLASQSTASAQVPSQNSTSFSAGTVIALSTVLPMIIIVLLGIIIYLLRTRPSPRTRNDHDHERGRADDLAMTDISRPPRPNPSFGVLPHRSVSPFNLSLHDLMFGRGSAGSKPDSGSIMSHMSSDSGHADVPIPEAPALPLPPPTPVLATRYTTRPLDPPIPGRRTSIYVDRNSVASTNTSTVVFARPQPSQQGSEEPSTGRLSEGDVGFGFGFRNREREREEYRRSRELARMSVGGDVYPSAPDPSETHATRGHGLMGTSKALKLLGIGPTPPRRAHTRTRSQPVSVPSYSLPSLQIGPRPRGGPQSTGSTPDSTTPRVSSPLGSQAPTGTRSQRIHPHRATASVSTTVPSRDRSQLSIIVPPRLGVPIRPVAELELELGTPASAPRLTLTSPRGTPRGLPTPASQLSELGATRVEAIEPSPETRERILRLLGRLPEPGREQDEDKSETTQQQHKVRRARSESGLPSRPSSFDAT